MTVEPKIQVAQLDLRGRKASKVHAFCRRPTIIRRQGVLPRALITGGLLLVLWASGSPGMVSQAQATNRVGLVVDRGDGVVVTRCVSFSENEINGYELLLRSGLELVVDQGTVCAIDGTGCPATNCWCQCQGNPCIYWSYWHWLNGEWQYAQEGPGGHMVENGDIEGWVWGDGTAPPPAVPFHQICFASELFLPLVSHYENSVFQAHGGGPVQNTAGWVRFPPGE